MVTVFNSFLTYFVLMLVIAAVAFGAAYLAYQLRKKKDAEKMKGAKEQE